MKFFLALFTVFLFAALPAQTLVFDQDSVSLLSIPATFQKVANWTRPHHVIPISCSVKGKSEVRIDSVYEYAGSNRWLCSKSIFTTWPDVCKPDSTCRITIDVTGSESCTYVFVTSTGQRKSFHVYSPGPALELPVVPPYYNHEQKQESSTHITIRKISNVAKVPVFVDSIVVSGKGWNLQTSVPFILQPGESKNLQFSSDASPEEPHKRFGDYSDYYLYFNVYHHRPNGFTELASGMEYLSFYHAIMLTGQSDQYFGTVKNGDSLQGQFTLQNNGTTVYSLKENCMHGVICDKDSLHPGETAIATVRWKVARASDSFCMEIPLLYDTQNGYCTVVFHGVAGKHRDGNREHSVNPDSMIYVDKRVVDLDTLCASKGTLDYDIHLRNNSPSAIVIVSTTTGDGGSYADGPREPIQPGQEFTVRFVQDLRTGRRYFCRDVNIIIKYLDDPNDPAGVITKSVTIQAVVIDDLPENGR